MSMHPHAIATIPEETVRVACAAFPRGNIYLTMRDQVGTLYTDENFRRPLSQTRTTCGSTLAACSGLCVPMC